MPTGRHSQATQACEPAASSTGKGSAPASRLDDGSDRAAWLGKDSEPQAHAVGSPGRHARVSHISATGSHAECEGQASERPKAGRHASQAWARVPSAGKRAGNRIPGKEMCRCDQAKRARASWQRSGPSAAQAGNQPTVRAAEAGKRKAPAGYMKRRVLDAGECSDTREPGQSGDLHADEANGRISASLTREWHACNPRTTGLVILHR